MFREGLPRRQADRANYLGWAVASFRLSAAGVRDETQMDADVISIEAARSDMELFEAFAVLGYPNEIGPGGWDIHSPRVASSEEMATLLRRATDSIPRRRIRGWGEVRPVMANLVAAARTLRAEAV